MVCITAERDNVTLAACYPFNFSGGYMLRAMLFIDYLNFSIAVKELYTIARKPWPRIDYTILPAKISE
jgi:hypothetical protein